MTCLQPRRTPNRHHPLRLQPPRNVQRHGVVCTPTTASIFAWDLALRRWPSPKIAPSDSDTTLSTGGAAIEFGLGGTIGEGLVIGGRVIGVGGENLDLEASGEKTSVDGSLSFATLQLFGDWYLDPKSGLHIEGALGPAGLTYDPTPDDEDDFYGDENDFYDDKVELNGFGGSLGVGLEGFVSDNWSLGGLLRLNWAAFDGSIGPDETSPLSEESADDDDNGRVIAISPMVMFTATYH